MRVPRLSLAAGLFALAALVVIPAGVRAAEVAYPTGSPIGLVPPEGMLPSARFIGFEDRDKNAAIFIATLPEEAYAAMEKAATPDAFKNQPGLTIEKREDFALPAGKAILMTARQKEGDATLRKWLMLAAIDKLTALIVVEVPEDNVAAYPDARVRATLKTVAARASVPEAEQLSLLPFTVGDHADFRVGGVAPGRALILTDAPKPQEADAKGADAAAGARIYPHIVIAAVPGPPVKPEDRDRLARDLVAAIPNLADLKVRTAEPLRIRGQQGYQVLLDAKHEASNTDIVVVQWLQFGGAGFLQYVGISPKADWRDVYPRFRKVRDSVALR